MIRYTANATPAPLTHKTTEGILIHERAEDMPQLPAGRFARGKDQDTMYCFACDFPSSGEAGRVLVSTNQGATWQETSPIGPPAAVIPTDSGAFMITDKGTLVAAFANYADMKQERKWDPDFKGDLGWREPTCTARSLDGGKTWQDIRTLHDDWTGAIRDMIQTRDGRIVFSTMKLRYHPGHHTVMTYYSDDDGATWAPSNVIDLGGVGHHGGVSEATLLELKDGRLLKYIRTNWGQLWRAYSTDGGQYWHPHGPAGIDAASAPAILERLASGRIVMIWNRQYPEGKDRYDLRGGDGVWSETPVSNFRGELSISFSDDECENWSPPVVIARNEGGETSYPYVFEAEPGVLWITAPRRQSQKLRMRLCESDFR